jgi:hypothetical protein
MNNEKVYIEGYVVGFTADTTGTREKQIQVSSGEIVSIDEGFIHKSIAPEKVKIPQCVADWIKVAKPVYSLSGAMVYGSPGVNKWLESWDNQDLFARAWLDGYEVEKEAKYTVKIKVTKQYLCNDEIGPHFSPSFRTNFTKSNLEELGFGWVFFCEGVEVEEVL